MSSLYIQAAAQRGFNQSVMENMPHDIAAGAVLDPIASGMINKLGKDFYPKITPQEFQKYYSRKPSTADLRNHDTLHERYSRPPEDKEIRNFKALDRQYKKQHKLGEDDLANWQPQGEAIDRYRAGWGNDMVGPRGLKPSWNAIQERRAQQNLR